MKPDDRDAAYLWDMLQSARDAHELRYSLYLALQLKARQASSAISA